MSTDILLNLLKYVSIALSAAFGVLSLLTEHKDKEGRSTRWGRIALVGVLASAATTAVIQTVEIVQKDAEKQEADKRSLAQLEQNTRILTDINRGLNPLTDVSISFWLDISLTGTELTNFKNRFVSEVAPVIDALEKDSLPGKNVLNTYASAREMSGKVKSLDVNPNSPLFPTRETERFAYTVFSTSTVTLYFYKQQIPIKEFPYLDPIDIAAVKHPDLTMRFDEDEKDGYARSLEYDLQTQGFAVRGSGFRSDRRYWESTGKLVSLLDLVGSQVFIDAGHLLVSFTERDKRVYPTIHSLFLRVADRQDLIFRESNLTPHRGKDGSLVYEYRFPDSIEKIYAALR